MIRAVIPVKTTNPNNGSAGWSKNAAFAKARRRKLERTAARLRVMAALPRGWADNAFRSEGVRVDAENENAPERNVVPAMRHVDILVTRVAPSEGLDPHDGLGAALKGCIDGIGDALGLANDRDPRVRWVLGQRRGRKGEYAVEVEIRLMAADVREVG